MLGGVAPSVSRIIVPLRGDTGSSPDTAWTPPGHMIDGGYTLQNNAAQSYSGNFQVWFPLCMEGGSLRRHLIN